MKDYSEKYFKSDCYFHEEILGKLEDSIQKNSDYSQGQKDELINILYSKFYHAPKYDFPIMKEKGKVVTINF